MIIIKSLHIYPVKSLQGIDLNSSELGVRGLQFDRTWMVTDAQNRFITQRHYPKMATIEAQLTSTDLILNHSSMPPLHIDLEQPDSDKQHAIIWDDEVSTLNEGDAASAWLTEVLGTIDGKPLNLLRYHPDHIRAVSQKHLKDETSHTAFADGFPFLIVSEESLHALNQELIKNGSKPVTMDRFRPNIVISGIEPFGEDQLDKLSTSSYAFGIRKPCQRCHVTTIDQTTGKKVEPKEPLRTLLAMNTQPDLDGAHFGQNATLLAGDGEIIRVGDQLDPH